MAASNPQYLIASYTGIAMSSAFAGVCLTLSYVSLPSLLLSSSAPSASAPKTRSTSSDSSSNGSGYLARQWQRIYDIGKFTGPPVALCGGSSFVFAARQLPSSLVMQRRLCYTAAVLAVIIGPFTVAIMSRTNAELNRRADLAKQGIEEDEETLKKRETSTQRMTTPDLVSWWGQMNAMRAVFPLVGITAAVAASVL